MHPEISRRCLACGASYREGALFCPECGKPLTGGVANEAAKPIADDPPERTISSAAPVDSASALATGPATIAAAATDGTPQPPVMKQPSEVPSAQSAEPQSANANLSKAETARDKLHRASTATREALVENVKRVDKIRQVSTVMFEEASYDPSLRFVLVALGLFIVFVVLLILSKVMG